MFYWKKRKLKNGIDMSKLPKHIGFIMDGNGRWAKKRGLPRSLGHREGVNALKRVVKRCCELNIPVVSLYALSTENLKRPQEEVNYIFKLIKEFAEESIKLLNENNCSLRLMGDLTLLPDDVREVFLKAVKQTKQNTKTILNMGLCYGARHELVQAFERMRADNVQEITESVISSYLYTSGLPDPDLIVRASGECRLSNFMMYQVAYSELYFPEKFWPDFTSADVDEAIVTFQKRNRRFGNV